MPKRGERATKIWQAKEGRFELPVTAQLLLFLEINRGRGGVQFRGNRAPSLRP
jgi:hypothetical protein